MSRYMTGYNRYHGRTNNTTSNVNAFNSCIKNTTNVLLLAAASKHGIYGSNIVNKHLHASKPGIFIINDTG